MFTNHGPATTHPVRLERMGVSGWKDMYVRSFLGGGGDGGGTKGLTVFSRLKSVKDFTNRKPT